MGKNHGNDLDDLGRGGRMQRSFLRSDATHSGPAWAPVLAPTPRSAGRAVGGPGSVAAPSKRPPPSGGTGPARQAITASATGTSQQCMAARHGRVPRGVWGCAPSDRRPTDRLGRARCGEARRGGRRVERGRRRLHPPPARGGRRQRRCRRFAPAAVRVPRAGTGTGAGAGAGAGAPRAARGGRAAIKRGHHGCPRAPTPVAIRPSRAPTRHHPPPHPASCDKGHLLAALTPPADPAAADRPPWATPLPLPPPRSSPPPPPPPPPPQWSSGPPHRRRRLRLSPPPPARRRCGLGATTAPPRRATRGRRLACGRRRLGRRAGVAARQTPRQGGGGRRGGKPDNTVFIARARQSTARPLSAARSLVVDQSRARVPADHGL
ncbi:hypothetical protein BU14_2319s0001, partial [Porphyra umbilicalis]